VPTANIVEGRFGADVKKYLKWIIGFVGVAALLLTTFVYNKLPEFREKAKQSEVKANLSALMSAERAHRDAWGEYTDDFEKLGVARLGSGSITIGFMGAKPGSKSLIHKGELVPYDERLIPPQLRLCADCAAGKSGFRVFASFDTEIEGKSANDIWTLDQDGKIEHVGVFP
jgi:hypothetical protein